MVSTVNNDVTPPRVKLSTVVKEIGLDPQEAAGAFFFSGVGELGEELTRAEVLLLAFWDMLRRVGLPVRHQYAVLKLTANEVRACADTGAPVVVSLVDNTLLLVSGWEHAMDYRLLRKAEGPLPTPVIMYSFHLAGLLTRVVGPCFDREKPIPSVA